MTILLSIFTEIRTILRGIRQISRRFDTLEALVTDLTGRFDALNTRIDDIKSDVAALREQLDNANFELPAEAEAALARLEANVGALDEAAGDADGSDETPTEETARQ